MYARLEERIREKSKVAVRYFSKSGNTKKLADEIAKAVGCKAEQIPSPIEDKVDILFLGASVYWGGISSEVKGYIQTLNKDSIGKVVVFSSSALTERAFLQMQKKLQSCGIPVESRNFYCRGEFTAFHKGRPNREDLDAARKFSTEMIAELHRAKRTLMECLINLLVKFFVFLSRFAPIFSKLGFVDYRDIGDLEKEPKLHILLVGYNGARNTGADVRVAEIANQLQQRLGKEKAQISVMTLDEENICCYFDSDIKLVPISYIFFVDVFRACRANHAVILCEGSTLKSKFANALTLYFCDVALQ